jgi:SAM-dependent methyltransferase
MLLADASPGGFQERGQFVLPDHQPAVGGTFPVITGGHMYLRDNDHLFCFDLRATRRQPPPQPRTTRLALPPSIAGNASLSRPLTAKKQPNAIFVPTPHDVVAKMLELAEIKMADTVFDLGSGDGRIVIAAAKNYGAKAIGVELDQELIRQSRERIVADGLAQLVQIEQSDLFTRDLGGANVIAVYLPTNLMDRLLPQLAQMKPGTRIVSHFFKFTDIPPEKSLRIESQDDGDTHDIHLWTAPLRTAK